MTLIARLRFKGGAPLYLGDALLSTPNAMRDRVISVPAAADINAKLPDDAWGVISGLRQKLNLLNGGDLLVAWAGSELQARTALREMEEAAARGAKTSADFLEVLEAKPDNEIDGLTLLGTRVSAAENGTVNLAQWALQCPTDVINGIDCRVAGSGADSLTEMLPELLQTSKTTDDGVNRAYQTAMTISGLLIGNEFDVGGNLAQMWGGAFEAAYVSGLSLQKLTNVLHTFWWLEPINEKQAHLRMWIKFAKYDYVDDYLFVDVVELQPEDGLQRSIHSIAPLLRPLQPPSPPSNFAYDTLACHVRLTSNASQRVTLVRHLMNPLLVLDLKSGAVGVSVQLELFHFVQSSIQHMCELEIV